MKNYIGPIILKKMPRKVRSAYNVWRSQRQRCYNRNVAKYQSWWGKNIQVEYTSREFINWFLKNTKNINDWGNQKYTVGRKNHDKNYSFKNIQIQTRSSNAKESRFRNRYWKGRIFNIYSNEKKFIIRVFNTKELSDFCKIDTGNIFRVLQYKLNRRKTKYIIKMTNNRGVNLGMFKL
jgi:hypothetical protein